MKESIVGKTFGRWTVLEDDPLTSGGERKWLCECTCGTRRYVLERSLTSSGSQSCGCLRKEAAAEAVTHDLAGKVFGELIVLGRAETSPKNGGVRWTCRCSCGRVRDIPGTLLVTGRRTHCGCRTVRGAAIADIRGKVFGHLTALYPTDKRDAKGFVLWHCRCTCGNEADISYNCLVYAHQISCGCEKRRHEQSLGTFLVHIDSTSLDALRSKKCPVDNTSGTRGVYRIHGKYVAKIVFQKKQFYLGTYTDFDDAVRAREEAERAIFEPAVAFYEAWCRKASLDPVWAAENPARVTVCRGSNNRLYLETVPEI